MYNTTIASNISMWEPSPSVVYESEVRTARILLLMPRLIFLILILLVGVIGNLGVLYIYHFKWRASVFSFFVKALAVLDLVNCFSSVPGAIILVIGQDHIYINILCAITPFSSLYISIASGILFVIIAVQRYFGICQPLRKSFGLPLAKKLCALAMVLAIFPSVLRLALESVIEYTVNYDGIEFNITMCVFTEEARRTAIYKVYMGVLAVLFIAIFGTLIVLYILMWKKMISNEDHRSELFENQPSTPNLNRQTSSNKNNTFKILFAVTMVFLVSYLPHLVIVTFRYLDHDLTTVRRAFYDLAYYSPLWNNAANPLIYSFFSAEFRFQCRNLFFSTCCKSPDSNKQRFVMGSLHVTQASRRQNYR